MGHPRRRHWAGVSSDERPVVGGVLNLVDEEVVLSIGQKIDAYSVAFRYTMAL